MGIREDLLFGEIALNLKVITAEQLNECVEIQEKEGSQRQLGIILVEKKYLTEEILEQILVEQQKNLLKYSDYSQQKQRSRLFGQMAISRNYITPQQLNETIREQAKIEQMGMFLHLGEIFIKKNFMTQAQVDEILSEQRRLLEEARQEEE